MYIYKITNTKTGKDYKKILKNNNVFLRSGKYYMSKEEESNR